MDTKVEKTMNGSINVIKLMMAISIFLMHCSVFFGDKRFQGSYIFVEWFYVLIGYTLAKAIINLPKESDILISSTKIIYKRISKLMPCYIISCIMALIVKVYFKVITILISWDINKIVHEMILLQMTSIETTSLTGTAWFLSSMMISLIIIVPVFVKLRKRFYVVAILLATTIYIYINMKTGHIWGPMELLITYKGNLRAVAAILLGTCGYAIKPFFDKLVQDTKVMLVLRIAVFAIYFSIFCYMAIVDDSIIYFVLPYIFAILISLGLSLGNGFIKDNKFTRFLGDVSMVLFMNHYYVAELVQVSNPYLRLRLKYLYSGLGSLVISIAIYLVVNYLFSKIIKNL